jgi:hypothetical protein
MFKLGINKNKIGYRTSCFIPENFYDGQNMWLVKAPNLNRGRCIKIGNSTEEIKNIIKKFYDGILRDFKNSETEEQSRDSTDKNKRIVNDYRRYRSSCVLLQKYLEKPLLYWGRKFDIRIWVLYSHRHAVYAFK